MMDSKGRLTRIDGPIIILASLFFTFLLGPTLWGPQSSAAPNDQPKSVYLVESKVEKKIYSGTAFAIGTNRLLTAGHNVAGADSVRLVGEEPIVCKVIKIDEKTDVAILSTKVELKPFKFSKEQPLLLYVSDRGTKVHKRPLDRYEIPVGIDLGNSGAPLVKDGRVIGMLVGYDKTTKRGVVVHWTVLKRILHGVDLEDN